MSDNEGGTVLQAGSIVLNLVAPTGHRAPTTTDPVTGRRFTRHWPSAVEDVTALLEELWSPELAEALCTAVRHVAAPLHPGRGHAPPGGGGALDAWARAVVASCQDQGELRPLLRWLHGRERGSARVLGVLTAADPALKEEELDAFDAAGEPGLVPSEQVRAALQAIPFEEIAPAYLQGRHGRLDDRFRPVDAWDALVDLYDLPPRPDGGHPAADFARRVARHLSGNPAAELLGWPDSNDREPPGLAGHSGLTEERDDTPARLLVEIHTAARGRLSVRHRAYLRRSPVERPEPTSGWVRIRNVRPEQVAGLVVGLLTRLGGDPNRENHDAIRLELIVPITLLSRFIAARWEEPVPSLGQADGAAIRLGVKYQIIYRLREFVHCADPGFRQSHTSCKRRGRHLHENGHGRLCTRDDLATTTNRLIAEPLEDPEIVVYLASSPDTTDWKTQIASAVYQGIPVIAWRPQTPGSDKKAQTDIREQFRPLITERDGRVPAEHVTGLPKRLHELRRHQTTRASRSDSLLPGSGTSTDADILDFFVLYHVDVDSDPVRSPGIRLFSRRAR